MKKISLMCAVAGFLGIGMAVGFSTASAQTPRHLDPTIASVGKDPARSTVVSYDSATEALRGSGRSKYVQPLEEWSHSERPEAVSYRTRYKVPFEWIDREQFLRLERVSGSFDVVVNGVQVAYSQAGSAPAEFDITAASHEGNNDLEIVVWRDGVGPRALENGRANVPPNGPSGVAQPGIEGEVQILSQPCMRVRDVVIETRMEGTSGLLELGVVMKNHQLNARNYVIYYELLSPWGETLAEGHKDVEIDLRREDTVHFFANIPAITPWSHEEPRLYTLLVKTQNEGRFREYLSFPVGFRRVDFRDGMLRLDGVAMGVRAVDFAPTDSMAQMRERLLQLRGDGVNMLRLSGLPPLRWFYDLCDEIGMWIVPRADIDTHPAGDGRTRGGNPSNDPRWLGAYIDRTHAIYHGAKNHPCAVAFSLAERSVNGYDLYESYLTLRRLERHRPILYPEGGEWNNDPLDFARMESEMVSAPEKWVKLSAVEGPGNAGPRRLRVTNLRRHTPFYGEARWVVAVGRKEVACGSVPLAILAGDEAEFDVSTPVKMGAKGKDVAVRVEIVARRQPSESAFGEGGRGKKLFRDLAAPIPEGERHIVVAEDF